MNEYFVVIECPEEWGEGVARILAERLAADELPDSVSVHLWRMVHGTIDEQTTISAAMA